MIYNASNPVDNERAKRRLHDLIEKKCVFEITEKKPRRTLSQNSYLHLILGYFATETGCTIEYVKQNYFKRLCNPDLFVTQKDDKYLGTINDLKSSKDLDTGQMTTAIERFRNWSSSEGGIYLPEPNEKEFLQAIEIELQRYKNYL